MGPKISYQHQSNEIFRVAGVHSSASNMKTIAFFAALVAVALAAPPGPPQIQELSTKPPITILYYNHKIGPDGHFIEYHQSDGQIHREKTDIVDTPTIIDGKVVNIKTTNVTGYSEHISPEGEKIALHYSASHGEGFKAQGAHLPVAPANPHA